MATASLDTNPTIHIYPFSRLVSSSPHRWEKFLNDLEAKKGIISRYYSPAREAIARLTAERDTDLEVLAEDLLDAARKVTCTASQRPDVDNLRCFEIFQSSFLHQINEFECSLIGARVNQTSTLGGIELNGQPHMIVRDHRGRRRFVYLHTSNCTDEELDVYLELLVFIIQDQYGAEADALWCMDLKSGKSILRKSSKKRMKSKCESAAKHLRRFLATA